MAFRPLYALPVVIFGVFVAFVVAPKLKELATYGDQPLPSMMEGKLASPVTVAPFGAGVPPTDADLRAPGVKLVNFWASWCQPCRVEHPMLERLQAEGVTIYGMNYKDKAAAARGFLDEMGNPFAKIGADEGRMALDWGVYGVPETYVIDGTGKVVLRIAGPITQTVLESQLRPAMEQAK